LGTIFLVSDISFAKASSFTRQLRLLGRELSRLGHRVELCDLSDAADALEKGDERSAAILLGYPDRFSFLPKAAPHARLFLWCQLSRPAGPEDIRGFIVIPLTEITRRFLPPVAGIGPTIPHGVDTDVFTPHGASESIEDAGGSPPARNSFVVGTVGANSPRKCLDRILEAFSIFVREAPEASLMIKTDRIVSLEGLDLSRRAQETGIARFVNVVTEELTSGDLAAFYGKMDVYINLSEWEGFCIPIAEAMACGVPVITHPIQGPAEIIPYHTLFVPGSRQLMEDRSLLLFADPAKAAAVLMRAYGDRRILEEPRAMGIKAARERFDIRVVASMWDSLLQTEL
jgi:glycosyltransferase involved in cell wall biosynthesis